MVSVLLIFVITLVVSYLATIPPGPLSVFVIHSALKSNLKIALIAGLGGAICEMFYAFLATYSLSFFEANPVIQYWMQRGIILILLLIGFLTFFQKNTTQKPKVENSLSTFFSFFKGVSLSLFNPALFAFWVVVLVSLKQYSFFEMNSNSKKMALVIGAGIGTFLLLFTYAFIAIKKRENIFKYLNSNQLNKITGLIFIALSLYQMVDLFSK